MFEKLRVPILVVITFAGGAVGAGVSWGVTNERVDQARTEIIKLQKAEERHREFDEESSLRLQSVEIQLKAANRALERIENRLGTK